MDVAIRRPGEEREQEPPREALAHVESAGREDRQEADRPLLELLDHIGLRSLGWCPPTRLDEITDRIRDGASGWWFERWRRPRHRPGLVGPMAWRGLTALITLPNACGEV